MILPKFDFHEPTTIEEACQIIAELGDKASLIAGGTDLMVNMKKKILSPEHLVSLARIENLKEVDFSEDLVKIGACITVAELCDSDKIGKVLSALAQGAKSLGSPLIRNLATIGGNISSARPAADLPPSLMAYDATVILKSSTGERAESLDCFFTGPGLAVMKPDEVLTEIHIKVPPANSGAGYINLGIRKAQDINVINVASYLAFDDNNDTIQTARVVMGAVGPTPIRAPLAEKILIGEKPDKNLFEKAGEAASQDSCPITDFRGCDEYRDDMAGVLTKRTLNMAYREIMSRS